MTHDLLAERDRTHELQIDLTALELQMKHSTQDRKSVQEILIREQRKLDREMRNCKRKEQQAKIAQDTLEATKQLYNQIVPTKDST